MRGNELLDQMELVDAAYIEAADTMPKRKRMGRWVAMAACLSLVVLLCGVMVGVTLTDPVTTPPEAVPSAVIDWTMQAVWVDERGNVVQDQQPFEFSFECAVYHQEWDFDSATRLEYEFVFPEGFRYEIKSSDIGDDGAYPPEFTGYPYYVTFGYQYDFEKVGFDFCYWAFSLEKEWMIFEWEHLDGSAENPGRYLIATRDPDADPKEILIYFQGFLDSYSPSGAHESPPGLADYADAFREHIADGGCTYPHAIGPTEAE